MVLNSPDLRQATLRARLDGGEALEITALTREFGISVDTARRDLDALVAAGVAQRVRGGAVPRSLPARPLRERSAAATETVRCMAELALTAIADAKTLVLDGGTSVLALAQKLAPAPDLLVVTPSPLVGAAVHARGIETFMIGGFVSERGGISVGTDVVAALTGIAADVAVLGACGLDAEFGLSADDFLENAVKKGMAGTALRTIVLTGGEKLGRRARHQTLPPEKIDLIVTDADADIAAPLRRAGLTLRTCHD